MPLALAADYVVAREDVVLNPYYRHMGGLYGSEYWTYLLPRRVGARAGPPAHERAVHPIGSREAVEIGLLDAAFGATADGFRAQVAPDRRAARARHGRAPARGQATAPRARRAVKPLDAYRDEELARSHECFFGEDRSYHEARRRFVYKIGAVRGHCAGGPAIAPIDAVTAFGR